MYCCLQCKCSMLRCNCCVSRCRQHCCAVCFFLIVEIVANDLSVLYMVKRVRESDERQGASDGPASGSHDVVRDGVNAGAAASATMIASSSLPSSAVPLASPARVIDSVVPGSPSNRERFRNACMPHQVSCDLSSVPSDPGFRFSFQAVVLVVFPSSSNPIRRHVLLGDGRGTVGVTVWNAHVNAFSIASIGQCVSITKVSMTNHNGVRGLSLNKESTLHFSSDDQHYSCVWWNGIPATPPLSAILFYDQKDNSVVNVAGILGSVSVEQKHVRSDARDLLTLKIVDRTGIVTVRSWNHGAGLFQRLVDTPIKLSRVRVTSFGGCKTGELFDGAGTTICEGNFDGADDLRQFWSE
jgi:hypothetical protein